MEKNSPSLLNSGYVDSDIDLIKFRNSEGYGLYIWENEKYILLLDKEIERIALGNRKYGENILKKRLEDEDITLKGISIDSLIVAIDKVYINKEMQKGNTI
jgi:hypothetical protein